MSSQPPPLLPVLPGRGPVDMRLGFELIGCATSATQVEGDGIDNDLTRWAETHPGWPHFNPGLDHRNRIEADYAHLGANGHTAHGLSLDWARIEPREGHFDQRELDIYLEEILTCRRYGMEPVVTLHEYALPPWLQARGGVLAPDAAERFEAFTAEVVRRLGAHVTWWNTINEPSTLAGAGFLEGIWPPGKQSIFATFRAFDGMLRMHAAAARALRASPHPAKISFAQIIGAQYPYQRWNPADRILTHIYDYVANRWFLESIEAGKSIWPVGSGDEIPGLRDSLDYICLNYYNRGWLHFSLTGKGQYGSPLQQFPNPDRPPYPGVHADPDGIYDTVLRLYNRFHKPIMITENGVDLPEPDTGNVRGRAIVDHLAALVHCQRAGVPILGYLHWTDWDSPEWQDAWKQRYGIFGFDHLTGRRWDKPAASTFGTICRRLAIPGPWLSAENRQSPARRDEHCAARLAELQAHQRRHGGILLAA